MLRQSRLLRLARRGDLQCVQTLDWQSTRRSPLMRVCARSSAGRMRYRQLTCSHGKVRLFANDSVAGSAAIAPHHDADADNSEWDPPSTPA